MSARTHHDPVNHPEHYTSHPSGIECADVVECMQYNLGRAVSHIWRADLADGITDLEKAAWYLNREIVRRKALPVRRAAPKRKARKS